MNLKTFTVGSSIAVAALLVPVASGSKPGRRRAVKRKRDQPVPILQRSVARNLNQPLPILQRPLLGNRSPPRLVAKWQRRLALE
jgi:hypothetical protein